MPLYLVSFFLTAEFKITRFKANCEEGWDKHDIGGEDYCFKSISWVFASKAQEECEAIGASLPLPESSVQNEDLTTFMLEKYSLEQFVIGVSDSG